MTHPTTPKMIPVELLEKWIVSNATNFNGETKDGYVSTSELLDAIHSNTLSPDRERGEWQPIETAPRDGTPFLVLLEKEMLNSRMHVATFHPNVSMIGGHFHFDAPNPTHWQPLPSAPEVPRE